MRKLLLFLSLALIFTFSSVMAERAVNVTNITGQFDDTRLIAGNNLTHTMTFQFLLTDNPPDAAGDFNYLSSNSFDFFGTSDWQYIQATKGYELTANLPGPGGLDFMVNVFMNHFWKEGGTGTFDGPFNGGPTAFPLQEFGNPNGNDTAGFQVALTAAGNNGMTAPVTGDAFYLDFKTDAADDGETFCFEKTTSTGAWEWAALGDASYSPIWFNGLDNNDTRCFEVYDPPNQPPVWCDPSNTDTYTFNHCDVASYTLCATDQDLLPNDPPVITYEFAPGYETGFGTITGSTWNWSGGDVPISGNVTVEFMAYDQGAYTSANFVLEVTVTNQAPTITCPTEAKVVAIETQKCQTISFDDPDDCDAPTVSVVSWTDMATYPGDVVTIVGNDVCFTPAGDRSEGDVFITVEVTDGDLSATCDVPFVVSTGSLYQVEIEKVEDQFQGQYTDVFIKLWKVNPVDGIGGFNFLIAYDASALSFQSASEGDIYDDCGWEYFTYRFGADGNCDGGCPTGILRVVGMAETNNGPYHPDCDVDEVPVTLAELSFLVSNDRTLECQYVPIRFFWMECGDNTIASEDGSVLYLSEKVYEFFEYNNPFLGGAISGTYAFPTMGGTLETLTAEECYYEDEQNEKFALPGIGFQNGGIDIVCADSIDAPGDVNLNGLPYEIADAVMFTAYFVEGPSAFGSHYEGSVAATDTNKDGLTLTVADLVYLIRVVVGDAQPYPKTSPVAAKFSVDGSTFSINAEAGAGYLVFEGNVRPTLLVDNMDMLVGQRDGNTHVLIANVDEAGQTFMGDFLRADGRLISSEFASYDGQPMAAKLNPTTFAVSQNYPNPFNPTTTFAFQIPNGGAWTVDIYNVTGQRVETMSGVSESPFVSVEWDASGLASGIYFYKVSAGDHSATMKAVLLK